MNEAMFRERCLPARHSEDGSHDDNGDDGDDDGIERNVTFRGMNWWPGSG